MKNYDQAITLGWMGWPIAHVAHALGRGANAVQAFANTKTGRCASRGEKPPPLPKKGAQEAILLAD